MRATDQKGTGIDLRDYVDALANQLAGHIEQQRQVLLKFIGDRPEPVGYCPLIDCRPRLRLRDAIRETVQTLEETRSSFKSRRLEELRRKLQEVLVEESHRDV